MIKLLIDSASDIEQTEADELGVELVPMQIRFGKEEFLDGVNLSHGKFFEKLIESSELPQTSQINEFRFEEAFKKLLGRIHPGAVVLLHSTSKTNGEILDELLTRWEEMGYRFGDLEELNP